MSKPNPTSSFVTLDATRLSVVSGGRHYEGAPGSRKDHLTLPFYKQQDSKESEGARRMRLRKDPKSKYSPHKEWVKESEGERRNRLKFHLPGS
jgi:hypothetical protein